MVKGIKVAAFLGGLVLVLSSLKGAAPVRQGCLYFAETPFTTEAFYGLEDAQNYLRDLGIDPVNTPDGYDVTSAAGC